MPYDVHKMTRDMKKTSNMQMERLHSKAEKRRMPSPSGNEEFPTVTKKRKHVKGAEDRTDLEIYGNTSEIKK